MWYEDYGQVIFQSFVDKYVCNHPLATNISPTVGRALRIMNAGTMQYEPINVNQDLPWSGIADAKYDAAVHQWCFVEYNR